MRPHCKPLNSIMNSRPHSRNILLQQPRSTAAVLLLTPTRRRGMLEPHHFRGNGLDPLQVGLGPHPQGRASTTTIITEDKLC